MSSETSRINLLGIRARMPLSKTQRPTPFLSLASATFRLGDRLVFENTSWIFHRHEQWAIIGPNGSGKSVLADGLRGRLPLVQGEMRYHFQPPRGLVPEDAIGHVAFEDRKSEIRGTVVQSRWNSLEEEDSLLVRDFLSYERVMEVNPFEVTPQHRTARPGFDRHMRRAIALLQIDRFLPRTLLSLSNGERQRVQLARALAQPLRLLILDEPYVGLDATSRGHFHQMLERLLNSRLRVLLSTTRVEELPRHITHLLLVDDCRVIRAGPRAKVLGASARLRPGSFIHSPGSGAVPRPSIPKQHLRKPPGAAKLIDLRNVTVQYGSVVILRNLNWTVHEGESWALLGPNGSGKTTLLSLILGDNPQAYTNEVTVFGKRRGSGESIWHLKERIGWVSPELHLHFDDTVSVFEVVASGFHETIGLFARATPRQCAAVHGWLRHFGFLDFADLPMFSLSAGLQRVVLLARALVKKPRLLILDEPCQGLDPAHRDLILHNVDVLIRGGTVTAIFVTHRPEEIPRSIKRVFRLRRGGRP